MEAKNCMKDKAMDVLHLDGEKMKWIVMGDEMTTEEAVSLYYGCVCPMPDEWTDEVRMVVALSDREWREAADEEEANAVSRRVASEVEAMIEAGKED